MIKNYLKIAWRNLLRHKSFSLINILGLSIGIASCMLIFLFVHEELTFDKYNTHYNNILRLTTKLDAPNTSYHFATTTAPLGEALMREYPEVKAVARLEQQRTIIKNDQQVISEEHFYKADHKTFDVFTFSFVEGTATGALQRPGSIVLTEKMAQKYFNTPHAIGKTITCDNHPYIVTAVIANRPPNSDLTIDALMYEDYSKSGSWMDDFKVFTFVLFHQQAPSPETFAQKIQRLSTQYIQPGLDAQGARDYHVTFAAERLGDVHFSEGKILDTQKGNRTFNYMFSLLAVFILVIALLNYINLSTARATERAREVGVRKVNGATLWQLIRQFMFESFFLVSLAWLIALGLVAATLPLFNRILQTDLHFDGLIWLLFTVPAFVVTLLLAGIYPAFVLSSFNPAETLKGKRRNSTKGIFLRKSLTVAQFVITAALVTGALAIYSQLQYLQQKDLGYTKEQVLIIPVPSDSTSRPVSDAFFQSVKQLSVVRGATAGSGMQIDGMAMSSTVHESEGRTTNIMCYYYFIDPAFIPMMNIQLTAGRNFAEQLASDRSEAFIVNEAFVQKMGWKNAIGQSLEGFGRKGKVVGVVRNFYFKSLHNIIEPLVMIQNNPIYNVLVKTTPDHVNAIKSKWTEFFPNLPFEYAYMEDNVAAAYSKDRTTMTLFSCFTGLAIFISCLGLYGLISLMAIQRTKEIGIRKVLGATVHQLLLILTKDSILLIVLASVIGLPPALVGVHRWLTSYAYHTSISWWMFVVPLLINLLIALLVIARQVYVAAKASPVRSLKAD